MRRVPNSQLFCKLSAKKKSLCCKDNGAMPGQNSEDICFKGISATVLVGRRITPLTSLYKQGLSPAVLWALLGDIKRVVVTGLHWLSDAFKWLSHLPHCWGYQGENLSAYTLLAWEVALAQWSWGNLVFVSALLPSQFTTGCAPSSSSKGSKCVLSEQFCGNKAACIIYRYLFYEKRTHVAN